MSLHYPYHRTLYLQLILGSLQRSSKIMTDLPLSYPQKSSPIYWHSSLFCSQHLPSWTCFLISTSRSLLIVTCILLYEQLHSCSRHCQLYIASALATAISYLCPIWRWSLLVLPTTHKQITHKLKYFLLNTKHSLLPLNHMLPRMPVSMPVSCSALKSKVFL